MISTSADADADGSPELYIYANYEDEFLNENRAESIEAMSGTTGVSAAGWSFPVLSEGTLLGSSTSVLAGTGLHAAVFTSDGDLHVLTQDFMDADAQLVGNYARAPLVAALGAGRTPHALVVRSTGTLAALATSVLTPEEPLIDWIARGVDQGGVRAYVETPGVVLGDGAAATIFVRGRAMEDYQRPAILALSGTGTERFRTPLPMRVGFGFGDPVVGDWAGDTAPELFMMLTEPDGAPRISVRSSTDGSELATAPLRSLIADGDSFYGGVPVDVDGDGRVEIAGTVHPGYIAALRLGPAPTLAWSFYPLGADRVVNGQMLLAALDADPAPDLLRVNSQNALGPVMRLDLMGNIDARFDTGTGGVAARDENAVALIRRAGGPGFDVVHAGMADDRVGRVVLLAGDTLVPRWTSYLGDGMATPATRANVAVLYDPAAADVDGDGSTDVIVGGADGFLYALRSSDGSLLWALDLDAPPVHVAIADLDRDPALEILVSAADGHLYGIDGAGAYDAEIRVPPPDAGTPDAGMPPRDAPASGVDAGRGPPSSGCGCRATTRSAAPAALLLALVLALATRRR
jgi:MYXO-CTERM domain-containing protein